MLGMLGILDDFQQLTVAPWPTAIFGWAGSLTTASISSISYPVIACTVTRASVGIASSGCENVAYF